MFTANYWLSVCGIRLSDPPFQRVFTAENDHDRLPVPAVRPAISAGVHSRIHALAIACPCCQTRHFSGCSQPLLFMVMVDKSLSDPPFQRVFTAFKAWHGMMDSLSDPPFQRVFTAVNNPWSRPALKLSDPPFQRVFTALDDRKRGKSLRLSDPPFQRVFTAVRGDVLLRQQGCQTRHFSGCSQQLCPQHRRIKLLSDPPFQRVFTAPPRSGPHRGSAVRPAISAGVHSNPDQPEGTTNGCQTRHFSGCSQRVGPEVLVADDAVRPAISAGVHSRRSPSHAGRHSCQTRHFSGCSQHMTTASIFVKLLSDPPFQRVFTA